MWKRAMEEASWEDDKTFEVIYAGMLMLMISLNKLLILY